MRPTEANVVRQGFITVQVCVPKDWTDEQAEQFAEREYPCGTSVGWTVRKDGDEALQGTPARIECDANPDLVHMMLDA